VTDDLAEFWVHEVTVRRYTGSGAFGEAFAAAETLTGLVDDTAAGKVVSTATGDELITTAMLFLPPETPLIPVESTVTLPAAFGARSARAVAVAFRDGGPLDLPDHLEVALV
jgi:hypothetical protein